MGKGALAGLRALEMGQLIAGPFCGQLMADHGAEVIKIELPGEGDPMRAWGRGKPVWFPVIARNKKCITLDVRLPKGKEILLHLLENADFLVENFRPGTLEKWNLGYEALRELNRRLILVRVSGFGQTGPYAGRAGYGSIGEAMGGIRYLAGDPSTPPSRVGLSIGDSLAATFACMGAMMALHHRHRTGEGQIVDCAIYEAVLAMLESTVLVHLGISGPGGACITDIARRLTRGLVPMRCAVRCRSEVAPDRRRTGACEYDAPVQFRQGLRPRWRTT